MAAELSPILRLALLIPIAAVACGGSDPQRPDAMATASSDTAPAITTSAPDAPLSLCEPASQPVCVASCTEEYAARKEAFCKDGRWHCPSGFVDGTTCPPDACALTLDECCDRLTGELNRNPCESSGLRPPCPEGSVRSLNWLCMPRGLDVQDCSELDKQPCSGEVRSCRSGCKFGDAFCTCYMPSDVDAGMGIWHCAYMMI
jgi:hypothetical protein